MEFGPMEWIEIGFPGSKLSRGVVLPLKKLVDSGTIRIIDLVVLHKDGDGQVVGHDKVPDGLAHAALQAALAGGGLT